MVIWLAISFCWGPRSPTSGNTNNKLLLSNGTNLFAPTVILVSLDGVRPSYIQEKNLTPNIWSSKESGTWASYMRPSFPTLTFPNHYTIITGLYPESHGIIANNFYSPELKKVFNFAEHSASQDERWWQHGQPIWETVSRNGYISASCMWPGNLGKISSGVPDIIDDYDRTWTPAQKLARVEEWLHMEDDKRPAFMTVYLPEVDQAGHKYGPDDQNTLSAMQRMDEFVGGLRHSIDLLNLTDIVSTIFVSDHGMSSTSADRLVYMDDIIDMSNITHIDGWPNAGLWVSNENIESYFQTLSNHADSKHYEIYKTSDMPSRLHFSKSSNIAPLWVFPNDGWALVTHSEMTAYEPGVYKPAGLHGYDNIVDNMQSVFFAFGRGWAKGLEVEPFENVEIADVILRLMGLEDSLGMNNGTLLGILAPKGTSETIENQIDNEERKPDVDLKETVADGKNENDELDDGKVNEKELIGNEIAQETDEKATEHDQENGENTPELDHEKDENTPELDHEKDDNTPELDHEKDENIPELSEDDWENIQEDVEKSSFLDGLKSLGEEIYNKVSNLLDGIL